MHTRKMSDGEKNLLVQALTEFIYSQRMQQIDADILAVIGSIDLPPEHGSTIERLRSAGNDHDKQRKTVEFMRDLILRDRIMIFSPVIIPHML